MTDKSASEASLDSSEPVSSASAASSIPVLRVVRGDATPEEIAALVTVLSALGGAAEAPPRRTPEWQAHHRRVRQTLAHGPGGWRSSGLPR